MQKAKRLSPKQAVKQFCRECNGENPKGDIIMIVQVVTVLFILLKKVKETMSQIQNNIFLKNILNGSNKMVKEFRSQKKSLKKLNKSLVKE